MPKSEPLLTEGEHLAKVGEYLDRRQESFERCDTDGFVSQYCHGLMADLHRAKATIAANGGTSTFKGLFLRETGERVAAKLRDGQFGLYWMFCDENGKPTGKFLAHSKGTKRSAMYREGFEVRDEQAPANAVHASPPGSTGFSGLHSVYVEVYRTDGGYPPGSKVI